MKVLLLSTGGHIGGEETFTRNLALALMRNGHEVWVASGGEVQRIDLQENGILLADVRITSRNPWGLMMQAKALSKYVKENKFDVVHAQAIGPAIMGVLAKKIFNCATPWLWHNHGISESAYKYIIRHLNSLNVIVANSDYVAIMMKNKGVAGNKIVRIHNGINFKDFYLSDAQRKVCKVRLRTEFNIPNESLVIIYVGRLSPEKGVEVLIRGFKELASKVKDCYCLLVGDGILREELQILTNELGLNERVIFAGFRKDVRDLIGGCEALVLPSHIETFSLTTLQAFAIGTPCVCSDMGGTPEQILHKFSGLLFKDNDHKELASDLMQLLSDDDLAHSLAGNARELSRNYLNEERMTNDIVELYKTVINK